MTLRLRPHARLVAPTAFAVVVPTAALASSVELLSAERFVDIRFDVSALEPGVVTGASPDERLETRGFEAFEQSVLNAVEVDPAANPTGLNLSANARASQTSTIQARDSGALFEAAASVLGGSDPEPGLPIAAAAQSVFEIAFSLGADTDYELSGTGGGEDSPFGFASFSIALTDESGENVLPASFPVALGGDPDLPRLDLAASGTLSAGTYTFEAVAFSELLGFADFDFVLELAAANVPFASANASAAAVPSPGALAGGLALLTASLARRSRATPRTVA